MTAATATWTRTTGITTTHAASASRSGRTVGNSWRTLSNRAASIFTTTHTPAGSQGPLPPPKDRGTEKAAPATKAPKAGGGPVGGRGTDVATVQTAGIDFPFPGYLNNIVRQIALNFRPKNPNSPLSATVSFLIHRDGSVTNVKFLTRSGVYSFDLEAQGAVERASSAFGPLPDGFRDDVLPVVFSFDPRFLQ